MSAPHGPYAPSAAKVALAMAVSAVAAGYDEPTARAILAELRELGTARFGDVDGAPAHEWLALLEEIVERHGVPRAMLL